MDFTYTKEEEQFRTELQTWLHEHLPEGWLEGKRSLPTDEREREQFLRDWQRTLYEGGWAGIHWPKQYGGRGATLIEEVIYQQELAKVKAPPVLNFMGINMVGPTLIQMGTAEQKEKYIDKILSGEEIWCQGFSEPNAGSDLASIQTQAEKVGDQWIINGQKVWTTYAHMSDKCLILTRTKKTENKHHGLTAFLIDMDQKGVEVRPIDQINEDHDFNEIFLTDAIAYDEDIVGELHEGWTVSMALLMHERVGVASTIFFLEDLFEDFIHLAKEREQNGKRLIDDPLINNKLARLYVRTQGATLNYYRHLTKTIERGYPGPEGSLDKLLSSELMKDITRFAMTMLGPEVQHWEREQTETINWQGQYLQAFGSTIAGGTSEILKNVIGERILKLPKDITLS